MFPAEFDYVRAESLEHAVALLGEYGEDARLLAGGHSLLPAMKLRLARPAVLIDIGRLRELQFIREVGGELQIGALTTHHQLETTGVVAEKARALAEAARVVADVQVRNRGTIGGVLAHADPAADYTAVLLALGATVIATGPGGARTISLEDFFTGPFTTALAKGEVLTEVRIPTGAGGAGSVYRKFVRRESDYGLSGVAVSLRVNALGVCEQARVGVTCVAVQPYRATATEQALRHQRLTPEVLAGAAALVTAGHDALEDTYVSAAYRTHLVQVETQRALETALERSHK